MVNWFVCGCFIKLRCQMSRHHLILVRAGHYLLGPDTTLTNEFYYNDKHIHKLWSIYLLEKYAAYIMVLVVEDIF